jgi:ABC-type Zn uptake system ZnuABC Zn-binding protein ZnuA
VAPILNIVQNIGGDKIKLIGLVPDDVNSYTFELIFSDIIKIRSSNNSSEFLLNGFLL